MFWSGWEAVDYLNYFSSVFNLMNVAIGSGIIGLGFVANTMGYIPFVAFNLFVSFMSIFTLNLICECATKVRKWERDQKCKPDDLSSRDEGTLKEEEATVEPEPYLMQSCEKDLYRYRDPDSFPNVYAYEEIANTMYGKTALIVNNLCILFYLFSCQCSYMTLIKETMPGIVEGLVRMKNPEYVLDFGTKIFTPGDVTLVIVLATVLIPLGFARKIDFLGFTSAIGMFAMITFVCMVIGKQSSISEQCGHIDYPKNGTKFNHNIETECEVKPFNFSIESIKSMGICVFAYLSHCNVLAIMAEVRGATRRDVLDRMQKVIYGAIIPCTVLYLAAAIFAYSSFYNHTQAQLIQLYSFVKSDGNLILYCNILVITCIIFSIPLAQYPCRNTIWNLLHTTLPSLVPPVFVPGPQNNEKSGPEPKFPWLVFICIMLGNYFVLFVVVWSNADFGLFLALAGAVSGSTVVMIFPAIFWLKMDEWKLFQAENIYKNAFCYFILGFGFVTLFGNTTLIVIG